MKVSDALIPGIVAAGGGSALVASIYLHEAKREAQMRQSRIRLAVTFPAGADPLGAKVALAAIAGSDYRMEYVLEVDASAEGIRHFLWVPEAVRSSVVATLSGALSGLRVSQASPESEGSATVAAKLFLPTPLTLATDNPAGAARTLLAGLASLAPGERATLKWAIRSGSPRPYAPKEPLDRATRDAERAWRHKLASGAGFRASGLVLVRTGSSARARAICEHICSSLRSRRGAVGAIRVTSERAGRSLASVPKTTRSSGWVTVSEALGLLGWPLGAEAIPGVEVGGARQLIVPRWVPSRGRHLFTGSDSLGSPRPIALTMDSARLHLGLLGSTGSGKTTVLIRLILDALAENVGGVFVDPKDAIPTLLDHVPAEYAERILVLDPAQPGPIPGLDLFGTGDAVMRSDVLLSVIRGVTEGWGPRIERYLRLGLRSLAALPEPVLYDWLRLYTDPVLRRSVTGRITDPIIAAEWRAFEESLSPAEQVAHIAPAIARITDVLSRPALRAVLSQPQPKLNLERLLEEGRWLCVSTSPGTLGEPAAELLAGVVTYLVWVSVEKRAAIPPERRQQVMLVLDELQSLVHLPVGPEVFFERTRSLNCAVVAATQAASRLPERARISLLANAGSLLTFKTSAKEAEALAPELSPLTAGDLAGLARYEIAGRVNTGGQGGGSAVITGRTDPLPPATGQGATIRRASAERYGRDPREVEEQLRRRGMGDEARREGGYGRRGGLRESSCRPTCRWWDKRPGSPDSWRVPRDFDGERLRCCFVCLSDLQPPGSHRRRPLGAGLAPARLHGGVSAGDLSASRAPLLDR
ncbi:MAG TPA: hypothetical protein VL979_08165 [Solirubrobacteraceae bacterium]|nr:hypothetical protein [Solirubrobacteraceae bacterium]